MKLSQLENCLTNYMMPNLWKSFNRTDVAIIIKKMDYARLFYLCMCLKWATPRSSYIWTRSRKLAPTLSAVSAGTSRTYCSTLRHSSSRIPGLLRWAVGSSQSWSQPAGLLVLGSLQAQRLPQRGPSRFDLYQHNFVHVCCFVEVDSSFFLWTECFQVDFPDLYPPLRRFPAQWKVTSKLRSLAKLWFTW